MIVKGERLIAVMPKFVVLDNAAHKDLRVKNDAGVADAINQALVFPSEFLLLQREYPIFFRCSDEGKYYAVVILGLDQDENLFLKDGVWDAYYIPCVQKKGPFALEAPKDDVENFDPRIVVNLDDPRVNEKEGDRVFLPYGGNAPYLEGILESLKRLHAGAGVVDAFFDHMQNFDLLEPVSLQLNLSEDQRYSIPDLFTISKSRMAGLTGDELFQLNQLGLLEHCFAVMSSAGNMSKIVDRKAITLAT